MGKKNKKNAKRRAARNALPFILVPPGASDAEVLSLLKKEGILK